jgi:hypothetical protein
MAGSLGMGTAQYFSDQFHGIAAPARGEAVPKAARKLYPECGGIVPSVKRTGAGKPMSPSHEPFVESVEGEYIADCDLGLQISKVEFRKRSLHRYLSRAFGGWRWFAGEKLEIEFFVKLGPFRPGSGKEQFRGHVVEKPQVAAGVIHKGLHEGPRHELRRARHIDDVLQVIEKHLPVIGFQHHPVMHPASQGDEGAASEALGKPHVPAHNGCEQALGVEVGASQQPQLIEAAGEHFLGLVNDEKRPV